MALFAARVGVPVAVSVTGLVLVVVGGDDRLVGAGVMLIGIGLLLALINVLLRLGLQSERDREREERAREYFDRHGRWPTRGSDTRSG